MKLFWALLLVMVFGGGAVYGQDEIPGRIAYIGEDYNVYTFTPATDETIALTDDASENRRYQYPTWSTDGRLAFFCCDSRFQSELMLDVLVSDQGSDVPRSIYSAEDESFTYAYWSPVNCDDNNLCRDLAVLVARPANPFKVEVVRDLGEKSNSTNIGSGAPFYFSWSPDGTRLLRHINTLQLDIYNMAQQDVETAIGMMGSDFPAPAWSPVDDRLLVGIFNESDFSSNLTVIEGDQQEVIEANIRGALAFNWSPDGQYIAYRVITGEDSKLTIIEAQSGTVVTTVEDLPIVAFFWSPDSTKIAYTTISTERHGFSAAIVRQNDFSLDWMTLDVASGDSQYHATFTPTDEMAYILLYFDQFAQSHQLWSPDSRYVVYAENKAGDLQVSVLDITRSDAVPFSIAKGLIGIWSYE